MAYDIKIRETMCRRANAPTEIPPPVRMTPASPPARYADHATVWAENPFSAVLKEPDTWPDRRPPASEDPTLPDVNGIREDTGRTRVAELASEAPTQKTIVSKPTADETQIIARNARLRSETTAPMRAATEPSPPSMPRVTCEAGEAEINMGRAFASEMRGVAGETVRVLGVAGSVVGIAYTVTQNTPAESHATVLDPIDPHYFGDEADKETEYFVRLAGFKLGLVKDKPTPPWRHPKPPSY
jgi:hypothetical protein